MIKNEASREKSDQQVMYITKVKLSIRNGGFSGFYQNT